MNKIEQDKVVFQVSRKNHENIVMMTEDDYNSLCETLYLLSSPNNAVRLLESISQADNGDFVEVNLDEDN
jgi:antitoxin YefM